MIGDLISLRELHLTNNSIRNLPYEIGKLFRLQSLGNDDALALLIGHDPCSLGLSGNPLPAEILSIYTESNGLQKLLCYFLDNFSSSVNGIHRSRALPSSLSLCLDRQECRSFLRSHLYIFSAQALLRLRCKTFRRRATQTTHGNTRSSSVSERSLATRVASERRERLDLLLFFLLDGLVSGHCFVPKASLFARLVRVASVVRREQKRDD